MKPTMGCIVRYIGNQGAHSPRAAIVTCAQADVQPGTDLAPLDSDMHVYLWVFTPGSAGFAENNVPFDPDGAPGTWSWPPVAKPKIPDTLANRVQAWIEGDDATRGKSFDEWIGGINESPKE